MYEVNQHREEPGSTIGRQWDLLVVLNVVNVHIRSGVFPVGSSLQLELLHQCGDLIVGLYEALSRPPVYRGETDYGTKVRSEVREG